MGVDRSYPHVLSKINILLFPNSRRTMVGLGMHLARFLDTSLVGTLAMK